jgi:hypothetical protein
MAGKVVQLQALTRDGANVNVKCATNHTDIFFSLGKHWVSYLTSFSSRKEILVIETQFGQR